MGDHAQLPGYRFLGGGPEATSGGRGWHLAENCFGRFGSSDGDDSIAVYRQLS